MVSSNSKRRIFVGDVQGCADELDDLLKKLGNTADAEIWFAGDLVNRGPGSARALRRIIEIGGQAVLGNHDLHLLGVANGNRDSHKGDTLDSVLYARDRDDMLAWLRNRPLVAEWDDIVLVHAGVSPAWQDFGAVARPLEKVIREDGPPFGDFDLTFLTRVRECGSQGQLPGWGEEPADGYAAWDKFYKGERTVVFGHWAQRGIVRGKRVRGLDSGCVWGGELTAWIAEEDRFVSVPARRAYRST